MILRMPSSIFLLFRLMQTAWEHKGSERNDVFMLECGTKQDILNILNDEGIIDTITSAVPVMLDKL